MLDNEYNFFIFGYSDSDFDQIIDTTNTVNGKPIYYLKNEKDKTYDASTNAGTIYCISCDNVTIKDLTLTRNGAGVYLWKTNNSTLENLTVSNNAKGICLYCSPSNTLIGNTATSNGEGIYLQDSHYNKLIGNTTNSNYMGIVLVSSSNNTMTYHTANSNFLLGIQMSDSNGNLLINSKVNSTDGTGIALFSSSNNIFTNNTVSSNRLEGMLFLYGSTFNTLYHNNIYSNNLNVYSDAAIEVSYNQEGNWWGHTEKPGFWVCGGVDQPYDSNTTGVVDPYPYLVQDGWLKGYAPVPLVPPAITCTVFTDADGYATAWPFKLGSVGEVNLVTATVSGTDLSVVFQATSTGHLLTQPVLDIACPTVTNDTTPLLSGTAGPYCTISLYTLNHQLIITTTSNSLGYWSVELPFMADGIYYFMMQASKNGDLSPYVFITITIDTTAPLITISKPQEGITVSAAAELIFDIFYSDPSGIDIDTLEIYLNNKPISQVFETINSYEATYYPKFVTLEERDKFTFIQNKLFDGTNELSVILWDKVGNYAEVTRQFNVTLETVTVPIALEIVQGNNQKGLVGRCAEIPLVVRAYNADNYDESFQGVPLRFEITEGGGFLLTEPGYSKTTDTQGLAGVHYHYGTISGTNKVKVSVLGDHSVTPKEFDNLRGYPTTDRDSRTLECPEGCTRALCNLCWTCF
jgi:parallel beta-helix repeat protein